MRQNRSNDCIFRRTGDKIEIFRIGENAGIGQRTVLKIVTWEGKSSVLWPKISFTATDFFGEELIYFLTYLFQHFGLTAS